MMYLMLLGKENQKITDGNIREETLVHESFIIGYASKKIGMQY